MKPKQIHLHRYKKTIQYSKIVFKSITIKINQLIFNRGFFTGIYLGQQICFAQFWDHLLHFVRLIRRDPRQLDGRTREE